MKSWRPFTWVILVVQIPFVIWAVTALVDASESNCEAGQFEALCRTSENIGTTVGLLVVLLIWASIDVILAVNWVITNSAYEKADGVEMPYKKCPECMEHIGVDARACRHCGHRFPATTLKCFNCQHPQVVLAEQERFECEQCGHKLKRKVSATASQ